MVRTLRRLTRRYPTLGLLALLAPLAPAAAAEGHASGTFTSHGATLGVADAYAFRGASALGGETKVLVVAVSNQGFVAPAIDEYWDRRHALDTLFRDEETGLVFFEFAADGRYRGYSFYFGPGNGCGYCGGGAVASSVTLSGERLRGRLTQRGSDDEPGIDLTIDVPLASDDHGTPQGVGGGAPGAAYVAYHEALAGNDLAALRERLSTERRATWDGAAANGDSDGFVAFLAREHPRSVRVVEAYVEGDHALALLAGEGDLGRLDGEALLVREQGAWRFEEELFRSTGE